MKLQVCSAAVLILFFQIRQIQTEKILCLLGIGTETAQQWNRVLLNELSAIGNDLTVVTPSLWNMDNESNMEIIHLENGMKFMKKHSELRNAVPYILQHSVLVSILNWYDQQIASCQGNLNSTGLLEVLNMALKEKCSFDMIIFDITYGPSCLLHLADLFGDIPVVGITSSPLTSQALGASQNSILNVAHDAFILSDFGRVMNYWTRIHNTILYGFDYIYRRWAVNPILDGLWQHYIHNKGIPMPRKTSSDLIKRFKVILANHHPTLHTLASLPYNVIPVPGLHIKPYHNTPPATDLSKFKVNFANGVVLINLDLEHLGEANVQTVLEVVRKFPKFGFIWKADKNMNLIQNKPKNLFIEKNLENQEILDLFKADKNIRWVFTMPEILRLQECLFHGIPVVMLTLTAEQAYLAQRMKELGVAINLQLSDLSTLASILESVLTNDTYQNRALQLQKSFAYQHNPSLNTAVWWVKHLLANPEANDFLLTTSHRDSFGLLAATSLDIVLFFEVLIALCVVNTSLIYKQTIQNFRGFSKANKKSAEKTDSKIQKTKRERKAKAKRL